MWGGVFGSVSGLCEGRVSRSRGDVGCGWWGVTENGVPPGVRRVECNGNRLIVGREGSSASGKGGVRQNLRLGD